MIQSYILHYLNKAKYEMIDNGKSFYAEIKDLRGVWATGKTLEECRNNLASTLEGWLILRYDGQIGVDLLRRILNQAGINRTNWVNK